MGINYNTKRESYMSASATMEAFEQLLNESLESATPKEGAVVNGSVIAIEAGQAIIDIGYKMEGRVDLREFSTPGKEDEVVIGDQVEVYLERVEGSRGEAVLSREKARREEAWDRLEKASGKEEKVDGVIFGRVKGGFTVDLGGAIAFLPGSQVDVRPIRDTNSLMQISQPFQILKMDRRRGNIVVSRRAILEESRAEQRAESNPMYLLLGRRNISIREQTEESLAMTIFLSNDVKNDDLNRRGTSALQAQTKASSLHDIHTDAKLQ